MVRDFRVVDVGVGRFRVVNARVSILIVEVHSSFVTIDKRAEKEHGAYGRRVTTDHYGARGALAGCFGREMGWLMR